MKSFSPPVQILLSSLLFIITVRADVKMPAIFSEHMVLQRSASVPVWGWADPGEEVLVTLGTQKASTMADQDGRWTTTLNLTELPAGPVEMVVKGKNEIKIPDVVIGEVWLASGQSNMEWVLKNTIDAEKEIAASSNPMVRQFLVKKNSPLEPAKDVEGAWTVASPSTSAGFTAVGYYFAKSLNSALGVPVGVINSTWGGTPSEAWTSLKGLSKDTLLAESAKIHRAKLIGAPAELKAYVEAMQSWTQETGRSAKPIADPAPFAGNLENLDGWETVKIPGKISATGLPEAGIVWLRRDVEAKGGEALPLTLPLEGFDQVFWNGVLLAETPLEQFPGKGHIRKGGAYSVPADKVKPGINILAIRLHQPAEPAEFKGKPMAGPIDLSGEWKAKAEAAFPPVSAELTVKIPKIPTKAPEARNTASSLFDGMIAPLVPYGLRGVIWYQGESNSSRAAQYRTAFPLLIKDWRDQWQNENLPFYFCQLANFMEKTAKPGDSAWAELREAQSLTLSLPATGEAVLIDIGEANDIHPRNKKDVGERLARIALAKDYGKEVVFSGPRFKSVTFDKNSAIIHFSHAEGGLVAGKLPETHVLKSLANESAPFVRNSPQSQLEGFAICGADQTWHWADATIDGETVRVSSPNVPEPKAVRYAWANNPNVNLTNSEGLPAAPFRTDDFPLSTAAAKY